MNEWIYAPLHATYAGQSPPPPLGDLPMLESVEAMSKSQPGVKIYGVKILVKNIVF